MLADLNPFLAHHRRVPVLSFTGNWNLDLRVPRAGLSWVLLHNGGFGNTVASSQNGFCSYKLSIHKKINIMQIITKNITVFIYLIFYHREILKLDNFMTLSWSYTNPVL